MINLKKVACMADFSALSVFVMRRWPDAKHEAIGPFVWGVGAIVSAKFCHQVCLALIFAITE